MPAGEDVVEVDGGVAAGGNSGNNEEPLNELREPLLDEL